VNVRLPSDPIVTLQVPPTPGNGRNVFYLAQTYRDLGETARAIELYQRRAALGGWAEEAFYSLYQVGVLRERLGDWDAAVPALIAAWNYRSSRIEPLYQLARGYRERRSHHAGHLFALRALNRRQPEDTLFVEPWIYRWGVLFEYSICAYWVGQPRVALEACDRLLAMPQLPDVYRRQTEVNRAHCLRAVATVPEVDSAPARLSLGLDRSSSSGTAPLRRPGK
jgi:tetratricopeptide (TPR) repeat protein